MRITTGMLNLMRRRTGRSSNGGSLLNYVKQKKGGSQSRLSVRTAAADSRATQTEKAGYEKLKKSADALTGAVSGLMAGVDGESGNIVDKAAALAEQFNQTMKNLKGVSGALNQMYRQILKEAAQDNRDALEEIGISLEAGGTLKVDRGKLAGVDKDKIKKLLGSDGEFTKKVGYVAPRVADNAEANAGSASSSYNAKGRMANSYLSRFNYFG